MSQRVESRRFPYLPLVVELGGLELRLEVLIDTGLDGEVALPPESVEGASSEAFEVYLLADGSEARAALCRGDISVGGLSPFRAEVIALGSEAIVGRGVMDRYAVLLDHGRRVVLEP